jgi:hypothetical protein
MGGNFEPLLEEVRKQQHIMEALEVENRKLRDQLADLREGQGIVVEICGKRFTLAAEALAMPAATSSESQRQDTSSTRQEAPSRRALTTIPLAEQAINTLEGTTADSSAAQKDDTSEAVPFLQEILIDEFASQMTSPLAVWNGPVKKEEPIDEEQKEALRRELMGSFLLE